MIQIAICDDDKQDMINMSKIVSVFFNKINLEYNLTLFKIGEHLLNSEINFDIIFLDIELGKENGIEVAQKLNERILSFKLILVSNFSEYLRAGYKVKADRFFTKPITYTEFELEMKDVLKDHLINSNFILNEKISRNKIYIKDVLYVAMLTRKTYLHTKSNIFETTYPLSYWKDLFSDCYFAQPHKSFLANLQNVEGYDAHDVFLNNNDTVPLSRFYKQEFMNHYLWFINKNL